MTLHKERVICGLSHKEYILCDILVVTMNAFRGCEQSDNKLIAFRRVHISTILYQTRMDKYKYIQQFLLFFLRSSLAT